MINYNVVIIRMIQTWGDFILVKEVIYLEDIQTQFKFNQQVVHMIISLLTIKKNFIGFNDVNDVNDFN